jgi:hypothetical protein
MDLGERFVIDSLLMHEYLVNIGCSASTFPRAARKAKHLRQRPAPKTCEGAGGIADTPRW